MSVLQRCSMCDAPVEGYEMPIREVLPRGTWMRFEPEPPPILEPCGHRAQPYTKGETLTFRAGG